MDLKFETRNVTNKLVIWSVGVPRINMKVNSNTFLVYDCKWYLEFLVYTVNTIEYWRITLHSTDYKEKAPVFPLIAYIRHEGRDLCLSQKIIDCSDTELWNNSCPLFLKTYPSIEVIGSRLKFVFEFHLKKLVSEISITGKISDQTTSSKAETKYPENHSCLENLSLDFGKLIEGGTDTDVLVKCGDVSIGVHKMILGARSEVFRTMMQTDMVEGREGIVEICDMEPKILKIFIQYIYTGNLPELTMDTALSIYEAADKYQVEALKKRSGHLLVKHLSPENALAILVAADAHSDTNLKGQLVSYISEEKIPSRKEEWLKFCNEYPKLGTEVLNFMFFK